MTFVEIYSYIIISGTLFKMVIKPLLRKSGDQEGGSHYDH